MKLVDGTLCIDRLDFLDIVDSTGTINLGTALDGKLRK